MKCILRQASLISGLIAAIVATSPVQAAHDSVLSVSQTAKHNVDAEVSPLTNGKTKRITPGIVHKIEREFKDYCVPSENPSLVNEREASLGVMGPGSLIANKLKWFYGVQPKGEIKTVVTQAAVHGKLEVIAQDRHNAFWDSPTDVYQYTPDKDFIGEDKVKFVVTVNGQKFRVSYIVKVVEGSTSYACSSGEDDAAVARGIQIVDAEWEALPFAEDHMIRPGHGSSASHVTVRNLNLGVLADL